MASADVRALVDEILSAEKELAGIGRWQPDVKGCQRFMRAVAWNGEIVADLCVKAYPTRPQPYFRVILLFQQIAVWRIDYTYTDHPHINSFNCPKDMPRGPITEPHYHSWADNRRLATAVQLPKRLANARVLPERVRTYEQAFRWFCGETKILLTSDDLPELPRRDTLL